MATLKNPTIPKKPQGGGLMAAIGELLGVYSPSQIMPAVGMAAEMPDAGRGYVEKVLTGLFKDKGTKAYGPMSKIHSTIGQQMVPKMSDEELLKRLEMFAEPSRMRDFFTP